jgi:hypothetical protein
MRELEALQMSGGPRADQWVGVIGTAEAFAAWQEWMAEHAPSSTTAEAIRAVPWRLKTTPRRPAPPVLRIRN